MKDTKQQWFKDAKYGLFIHWGLYALLAGEYNGEVTPFLAEWIMNTANIPVEEYEKLAEKFNPVEFNADEYVRFAKKWGFKYITFTSKHHDGFAMFDSKASDYNIVKKTPYGQDVLAELANACHKHDIKLCLYYSQAQDWHHPDGYRAAHDNSQKNYRRYLDEKCLPQLRELLTQYGEIGMIWFDTPMGTTSSESKEMYDLVKSIQPDCIVSGRIGNQLGEYMTTADNMIPAFPYEGDWEVPATLNTSWGYKASDHNWRQPEEIIEWLVKIVSRGGNYLLNIGPKASGEIPRESIEILDKIGEFLQTSGDSIYATSATPMYNYEQNDFLLTSKKGKLFIHLLKKPDRNDIVLMNIDNTVKSVFSLTEKKPLKYICKKDLEGGNWWKIELPEEWPETLDYVICCELNEDCVKMESLE